MKKAILLILCAICAMGLRAQTEIALEAPKAEGVTLSLENGVYTVRWKSVPTAMAYLISVYTRATHGAERTYLYERVKTSKTGVSFKESKLQPNTQYFIELFSTYDDKVSAPCQEIPVLSGTVDYTLLATPQGVTHTPNKTPFFDVSWQAVPLASFYEVYAYTTEAFTQDGTFTWTENFNEITQGTWDEPEDILLGGLTIDDFSTVKGWSGNVLAFAQGGIVIRNRFKPYWSYLDCPTMTLGNGNTGGAFDVKLKVQSVAGDSVYINLYEELAGRTNKVNLLETVKQKMSKNEETLTFHFTKGKPNAFVSIEVHTANTEQALIDEVSIIRPVKAGDTMRLLRHKATTHDIRCQIPKAVFNIANLSASALQTFTVSSGMIFRKRILSVESAEVDFYNSIENITDPTPIVWRSVDGGIQIEGIKDSDIRVYDLQGVLVGVSSADSEGSCFVALPRHASQVVVVAGKQTFKVAL